ncbi:hypothetical protein COOONC_12251, partial [Cooperia oncophora]
GLLVCAKIASDMKDMAQGNAYIPDDFEASDCFVLPVNAFDIPRCYADDLAAVVITEGLIRDRVRRLAKGTLSELFFTQLREER